MATRRILLADDSPTIQKVVNLAFPGDDVEIITVGDGDAAMREFDEAAPDLVLADVNMPGLSGYEICQAIKQNDLTSRVPVILLVGSFEPFDEQRAKQVGADDFLTKPFQSIRQLVSRVTELLEAKTDEENFLRPIENPGAPVSSFADTLEMNPNDKFDTADKTIEILGDAGTLDDEMIQTAQVGSLPVDETHKYESAPVYESFAEDLDQTALKSPYNNRAADYPPDEDWAKTQPLSKADLEELEGVSGEKKTASDSDFEEIDLLKFPQATGTEIPVTRVSADSEILDKVPNDNQKTAAISNLQIETTNDSMRMENLPPELIDAIADKVAEKLTNRVIKRVVGEVLAQMERRK